MYYTARGSSYNDLFAGAAYVIPGELIQAKLNGGVKTIYVQRDIGILFLTGEARANLVGSKRRISNAGDIDGDGYADLVIGAPGWGDYNYGATYIVWGHALEEPWE